MWLARDVHIIGGACRHPAARFSINESDGSGIKQTRRAGVNKPHTSSIDKTTDSALTNMLLGEMAYSLANQAAGTETAGAATGG
jgi:hypothetical protein